MYQHILVPTDGSACSDRAVAHAIRLASPLGAAVVFLYAMDTIKAFHEGVMPKVRRDLEAQGEAALARAEKLAREAGTRASAELIEGIPSDVIVERAADFDVIVMACHGKGLWKRLTVGSVTRSVLRRTPIPLLVIPCDERAA